MDIISMIRTYIAIFIALAQRHREISKNIADLKLEAAALEERISLIQEESVLVKQTATPAE